MELRSFVPILFLLFCVPRNGVSTFTVTLTKSPDKAVFGTNQFQLTCTYNVEASEVANSFRWQRKRAGEQTYAEIATFFPPSSQFSGSISEPALNSRVSLTDPTSGNTNSVLTFSEIQCNDEAEYRCEATYTTSTGSPTAGDSIAVQVSKRADFSTATAIPFSPGSDLKEGDTVTFNCDVDIGKAPQGTLHWYYFIDGQTVGTDVTNIASTPQSVYTPSTCSYKQTSTLVLTMEKRYNRFVVRCTLEQFITGQTGDGYRQTDRIPVNFEATTRPTSIQPTTIQPTTTTTAESKSVSTFIVTLTKSPDKAVFGTNQFQLTCTYNVGASEQANSFRWQRKRAGEPAYTNIATFFPQGSQFNGSISDPALNSRVSLTDPTFGNTNSVLTFSEIQCNDEAEYRCEGTYTISTGSSPTEGVNVAVQVSKKADFNIVATPIPFSPGSGLKEGDTVTFTCDEDIGKAPQGTLHWYYFIDGQTVGTDVTNVANTADSVYNPSTCSYKQISTLVLTMDKRYNQFVVRCTLEQFEQGQTGDGIRMTARIPVNYKPTITSISPDVTEYVRGQSVTLTCSGEGNPAPSTQWVLSNGTVVRSSQLYLMDLSLTTDHNYTCQLQNNYGGVNYTDSRSVVLSVVEATTRPMSLHQTTIQPTTTTTAESKRVNNIDCNFEDGTPLCGWVQDKTDWFDWSITSRAPSNNPMSHGHYLSIDASAHQQNETANLIGQPFHMENNERSCFTFWYHMYGRDMGALRLYMGHSEIKVKDTILWERQKNGGYFWKEAHVDITPPGPIVLMFEAIVGPGPDGDVAIDDIKMRPGACTGTQSGIIVG